MSNRINGDFNAETIEAFRSAYAAQILEPEDQEIDARTGLPTNLVLNTSPWIQHTGLWKANDGTDKNFVPNQTLVPGASLEEEDEDQLTEAELESLLDEVLDEIEMEELLAELENLENEDLEDEEEMSEEEFENLVAEILSDYEDEGDEGDEGDEDEDIESGYEEVSEEDIDALISELEQELDIESEEE